jgi:hypothetical protein
MRVSQGAERGRRLRKQKGKTMSDNLLTSEIPEKFKDPETGEVRIDDLARSYSELEKKLSSGPSAPKSPDDYCIECQHGLFEPDAEINTRLHAKGFSQDQAQEVYNLAAEKLMPIIAEMAADFQADREVEKLINHFGGPEQWKDVSRQLQAFGQKNLPADVLANLSSSYEGVLSLYRLMGSEEPSLGNDGEGQAPNATGEKELRAMMRDPKYWKDRDPSFVSKVTEGFKSVYGE